ncbi:MAG: transporter, partial [Bacteroidota bacterium]|nr:transporter [Bacteroidota bacterium]
MKQLFFILLLTAFYQISTAQGCVAIRNNGATCAMTGAHRDKSKEPEWTLGINSRYFKSYKHFVGTEEQKQRVDAGTEVINKSFSTEVSLSHHINSRWSVGFYAPIINNIRSSKYEHYGNSSKSPNARRKTSAFGLGDVRIAAYYWITEPSKMSKFNVQLGAGIKLPSGDYRYQDYFWKNDSSKTLGPVDQSIQLGDGGTGLSAEYNAYYSVTKGLNIYSNGYYLFNPREQNGVSTARGGTVSAGAVANGSDVMSVADQFMVRLGASFSADRFLFSGGIRVEGVPAKDLIGGSNGFRRPGYVVSVEPVVSYKLSKTQLYLSVPLAVERNRTQSAPDKIRTQITGVYTQGDAAFADYSIN